MSAPEYEVPCQDGSDPGCHGTVMIDIPQADLSPDQAEEIAKTGRTQLDDDLMYEYKPDGTICDACGSDSDYRPATD